MTSRSSTARRKSPAPSAATSSVPTEGLHVDWATHAAADFACKHFHYSRCIPRSKLVKIGVWEDGKFIGVVIFSYGAAPNIGKPYGLPQAAVCELTRIALSRHKAPVTQIVSRALKMLKAENPGVRLVVSYADPAQGHVGRIYQAGNWTYEGAVPMRWIRLKGEMTHPKTIYDRYGTQSVAWLKANVDPSAEWVDVPSKHKYLMPLDKQMKRRCAALAKPYPQPDEDRPPDRG